MAVRGVAKATDSKVPYRPALEIRQLIGTFLLAVGILYDLS
mgnify:CR=1 FL=1